ncbi:MAG: HD domain-containing protein [Oscillospiraceae bacterium]|nr:HD domain-containing protein [Oscillospiraceae bacterium]
MEQMKVYSEYVERMKEIRLLSTPNLNEVADAEEYSQVLIRNFSRIGELASENRKVIDALIKPVLASKEKLSEEKIAQLTMFAELLVQDANIEEVDAHLSELINDLLLLNEAWIDESIDDSARAIAMAKKVYRDYLIISGLTRYINDDVDSVREKALENRDALAAYLDKDAFAGLSDEAKGTALRFSLMGVLLYENNLTPMPPEYWAQPMEILKRAEDILDDPFYRDQLPDYDWETYEFRIYYYGSFLAYSILPKEVAVNVFDYAQKALNFLKQCTNESILNAVNEENERDLCYLASVQAGITPVREACDAFYKAYQQRDADDYSVTGINTNLDTPSSYLSMAKTMDLPLTEEDYDRYYEIEKSVLDYFHHIPKSGDVYLKCVTCFTNLPMYFREVPNGMTMEEFCVSAFAAIHPPTYIHINMVARLAECMTRHLLDSNPDVFIGFPGCGDVNEVLSNGDRIIHYAYHASLCHDIGKLFIIDTISMYGRNLLDDEFAIIKNHPVIGAKIAAEHESTRAYCDVIKGHHLWYDCSRGYPVGFNTFESPYKTIIDIVLAADCLDAATDTVGRSYNRGKAFADYEQEVIEGAGTHYAPFLVELFRQARLRADIEYLLSAGRRHLYSETFRLLRRYEA